MPMPIRTIQLRDGDQAELERLVRTRTTPQRVVERARIVLASASGLKYEEICTSVGVSPPTVTGWLDRYDEKGIPGLMRDKHRSGKPKEISPDKEAEIVRLTQQGPPKDRGTHWSTRTLAPQVGVSAESVRRIWAHSGESRESELDFGGTTLAWRREEPRSRSTLYSEAARGRLKVGLQIHAGAPHRGPPPTPHSRTQIVNSHPSDCPTGGSRDSKLSNPGRRHTFCPSKLLHWRLERTCQDPESSSVQGGWPMPPRSFPGSVPSPAGGAEFVLARLLRPRALCGGSGGRAAQRRSGAAPERC